MSVMTEVPEQELVARCLEGSPDHAAFALLYARFAPEVYRFLRRLIGDATEAEDALQETFIRLHRALGRFDRSLPLRPYVLGIARNAAIEALRRGERLRKLQGKGHEPEPHSAEDDAARAERRALVRDALATLPAEHRTVVVLRHTHGLKLREVAEALSCTPRTARNRLRAAAVLLQRELERRGVLGEEGIQ